MAPGPYDPPQMNTTSPFVGQIFNPLYLGFHSAERQSWRTRASYRGLRRLQICAMTQSWRASIASRAFTAVELLVLLAVLGLLASTLLPALAKSRPNPLAFQCLNNNRQLCAAWRMYADDNRDLIVYSSDDGRGSANPLNQYAWTWTHMDFSASSANWDTNLTSSRLARKLLISGPRPPVHLLQGPGCPGWRLREQRQ